MNKPKKIIALLLIALALTLALIALPACNKETEEQQDQDSRHNRQVAVTKPLKIGIVADAHVLTPEEIVDNESYPFVHYTSYYSLYRTIDASLAILKTAVDEIIAQDFDVVLVMGDLTETGTKVSLTAVAQELKRIEDTGTPVFVVNGTTDINNVFYQYFSADGEFNLQTVDGKLFTDGGTSEPATAEEFAEIFADFGYTEAVSRDENSLSYTADIPGTDYRIVVIDSDAQDSNDRAIKLGDITPKAIGNAQKAWLDYALSDAKKYGKEIIVMTKLPLSKYPVASFTSFQDGSYYYVKNGKTIQSMLSGYGVKYVFCGHIHNESTMTIETEKDVLIEEYTSGLSCYPGNIKSFSIKEDGSYEKTNLHIQSIPSEYIPSYMTDGEKTLMMTDYTAFLKENFKKRFEASQHQNICQTDITPIVNYFYDDITPNDEGITLTLRLLKELTIYPTGNDADDKRIEDLSDDIYGWMSGVNKLKLYGGEGSVQQMATSAGYTMPNIERFQGFTVLDYIYDLFFRMLEGNYNPTKGDTDEQLFTCIFVAGTKMIADIPILHEIHEVNNLVLDCDINDVLNNFLETGTLDLKRNDFLMAVISLFRPYLENPKSKFNVTLELSSSEKFLNLFSTLLPLLKFAISDITLFLPGDQLESSYLSIPKGEVYGEALITDILFPIMVRTAITL